MLTFQKNDNKLKIEHMFDIDIRGIKITMTDYKTELLKLILENDNVEQAILTASVIIHDLLKQHELLEEQIPSCLQVSGQTRTSC